MASKPRKPKASRAKALEPELLDADSDEGLGPEDLGAEDEEPSTELASAPASRELDPGWEPSARALSPTDPLKRYFEEVRRHPLLEPEEEFRLAQKLHLEGDLEAAKRLVQANLRLVIKIAYEYQSVYSNLMDLIQEGNVGLMKAVSKFDPTKGARLGYYASWWIRSYILKYLLENFRLVKIGTTQAQKKLFYHLMREKERLEAQGLLAAPRLLADKLHVKEKEVIEMEQRLSGSGAELSIDTPMDPSGERRGTLSEALPDSSEHQDDALARQQLLSLLEHRLPEFKKQLKDRELQILNERILAEDPKTLQEVADVYGMTRERVRQIEAKIIEKLREFLRPALHGRGE